MSKSINSDSASTLFDLEPYEEKIVIGIAISIVAFGVLVGPIAALAITGNLMKFFEWKANLTIGQGLLYIAIPISVIGIGTAFAVTYRHNLH